MVLVVSEESMYLIAFDKTCNYSFLQNCSLLLSQKIIHKEILL